MKKAVIFDMDGVLVDNDNMHCESFILFCNRYGVEMNREIFSNFVGMGNRDIMPTVFGREMKPEEIDRLSKEKEAIYREIYADKIIPLKGLKETLEGLKAKGVKVALGSSGITENVDFVLDNCGIREYFDAIANGDMVTKAKPDPQVFLLAADLLGVNPTDCVVFEDSFAGIKAARSANMKVIAVATTHVKEKHKDYDDIINDFTDISVDRILQ